MSHRAPARVAARHTRSTIVVGLVAVGAALVAVRGYQSLAAPSSSATSPTVAEPSHPPLDNLRGDPHGDVRGDPHGALGEADGVVPDGVTVFDGDIPAVAKLDPVLLHALRRAATVAAQDGVTFYVDSGWRSPAYQEQLLREAVTEYGSPEEAARWVATPNTSAHVSGEAVDIGHSDAAAWLSRHGAGYGLCQIYRNEPWHYELRPQAVTHGCPHMYADPTQDPRMQR
jgi:hypothetical protein